MSIIHMSSANSFNSMLSFKGSQLVVSELPDLSKKEIINVMAPKLQLKQKKKKGPKRNLLVTGLSKNFTTPVDIKALKKMHAEAKTFKYEALNELTQGSMRTAIPGDAPWKRFGRGEEAAGFKLTEDNLVSPRFWLRHEQVNIIYELSSDIQNSLINKKQENYFWGSIFIKKPKLLESVWGRGEYFDILIKFKNNLLKLKGFILA